MQIQVLKSKLHCVTVTDANLKYLGSITIDEDLMDAANMIAGEKVQIVDNNNGERFETYIIKGERGSGCICLNGAAARKVQIGDTIIIISYALMDFEEAKSFKPTIVFPKEGIPGSVNIFLKMVITSPRSLTRKNTQAKLTMVKVSISLSRFAIENLSEICLIFSP